MSNTSNWRKISHYVPPPDMSKYNMETSEGRMAYIADYPKTSIIVDGVQFNLFASGIGLLHPDEEIFWFANDKDEILQIACCCFTMHEIAEYDAVPPPIRHKLMAETFLKCRQQIVAGEVPDNCPCVSERKYAMFVVNCPKHPRFANFPF